MPKSESTLFWFAASFRIMDAPEMHDELTAVLGTPTFSHRRSEQNDDPRATKPWQNSIWAVESPISEHQDLSEHLRWVENFVEPHFAYLRDLIVRKVARIDIYMSYCCSDDHRGFGLDPERLSLFVRLGVRFELSIMT